MTQETFQPVNYTTNTLQDTLREVSILTPIQTNYIWDHIIPAIKDVVNTDVQAYQLDVIYDITSICTSYVPHGTKSAIYFTRNYGTNMTISSSTEDIMEYYNLWQDTIVNIYVLALQPHDENVQDIVKCDSIEHAINVMHNNMTYIQ